MALSDFIMAQGPAVLEETMAELPTGETTPVIYRNIVEDEIDYGPDAPLTYKKLTVGVIGKDSYVHERDIRNEESEAYRTKPSHEIP